MSGTSGSLGGGAEAAVPGVACCLPLCAIPLPEPTHRLEGYNNWWANGSGGGDLKGTDDALYDVYASDNSAPPGPPRTLCWRINDLTINGIDYTPPPGTALQIPVPTIGWQDVLRDWINSFVPGGDPVYYAGGQWGFLTDPTMTFSLTIQDGFDDHAGGCIWAIEFHFDGNGSVPSGNDWVVGAFNTQPMVVVVL